MLNVEVLKLDVDIGGLLSVWIIGVLKENTYAECIRIRVKILGLFTPTLVGATKQEQASLLNSVSLIRHENRGL